MLPASGALSSPPSSPTHSFLSSLLRTYGVKNMIIVQDNAKPDGGTIRQRNRWIRLHAVTATSTKPPPLLPTSSKCRWSSNSCSNSGGPVLQKQMYQCVQRGGIVKDERLPLDPAEQGHLGRPCPLRMPRFSQEDVPGVPASPKVPMRRASIEEDELARIAALQVCFTGEEEEGEEDEAGEIGEGEGVEDEGIYARQTHRSVSLDPIPSTQSTRRVSDEPLHNTFIGKVDAAFATPRRRNSWNDRYGIFKKARALDTIIATHHGSIPSSSQKVASQIDRILHDMGLMEHSTSSRESELSEDSVLLPPVRRQSWTKDEEEVHTRKGHQSTGEGSIISFLLSS
ncbi:hypothetical protein IV203_019932 [Nitzschia inconspicua]|uniref:Uncharacterized protein n=1 Tax=Nitzschia inconspicua TaxID=303405 RepID=A0A9K3M047_9STRA|nr:hypothetical protein IV203_019932 [Nitzschia inconspicua]